MTGYAVFNCYEERKRDNHIFDLLFDMIQSLLDKLAPADFKGIVTESYNLAKKDPFLLSILFRSLHNRLDAEYAPEYAALTSLLTMKERLHRDTLQTVKSTVIDYCANHPGDSATAGLYVDIMAMYFRDSYAAVFSNELSAYIVALAPRERMLFTELLIKAGPDEADQGNYAFELSSVVLKVLLESIMTQPSSIYFEFLRNLDPREAQAAGIDTSWLVPIIIKLADAIVKKEGDGALEDAVALIEPLLLQGGELEDSVLEISNKLKERAEIKKNTRLIAGSNRTIRMIIEK